MDYWPSIKAVPGVGVAIDVRDDSETWTVTRHGAEILRVVCEPADGLVEKRWQYRVAHSSPEWLEVAEQAGVDPNPIP